MKSINILFLVSLLFAVLTVNLFGQQVPQYSGNSPSALLTPMRNYVVSVKTGNWSDPTVWSSGVVPGVSDDITIAETHSVTIGTSSIVSYTCYSLIVGGTLTFEQTNPRSLTVLTSVNIYPTGIFRSNPGGMQFNHILFIGTNLTNDGVLDFYTSGGLAGADITFTGAGNNFFSGVGTTTDIRTITINKGTSSAPVLELNTTYFTVQGANTNTLPFLILQNGTFKISGSFTLTARVFNPPDYIIPATAGFWLNNPNFTVVGQQGTASMYGTLRISSGTFNVGTTGENSMKMYSGCSFIMEGGSFIVSGRLCVNTPAEAINYNQSGGTVTVCTGQNNSVSQYSFDMGNSVSSSYNMSGGSIVIQIPSISLIDYRCNAGNVSIYGGTLQVGNSSSGTAKSFYIQGSMPNLVIDNTSAGHSAYLNGSSTIYLNTLIDSSTTLNCQANSLTVKGDWTNNGSFAQGTGTITLSGTQLQYIGGSTQTTFYNLTVNNSVTGKPPAGNPAIRLSNNIKVNNILNLTMGFVDLNNYTFTIGTAGSISGGSVSSFLYNGYNAIQVQSSNPVSRAFPLGDIQGGTNNYRPVIVNNFNSGGTLKTYTASIITGPAGGTVNPPLTSLTSMRYYRIQNSAGMQAGTRIQLTFGSDDGVSNINMARVAQSNTASGSYSSLGGNVSGSDPFYLLSTSDLIPGNDYFAVGLEIPFLSLNLTAMLQGFYDGATMVSDSVTVELRNNTSPYAIVESQKVLLNSSGVGNPVFTIAVSGTSYYIVIKHRNGIETWSSAPQTFSGSTLNYDFTSAATQAYRSNLLLKGTKWCIISGDVNQDGSIDALDRSACWNDRNLSGYYASDLNGDGVVDALDRSIAWNNRNLSVQKPALMANTKTGQDKKIDRKNSGRLNDLKLDGLKSNKEKSDKSNKAKETRRNF